MKQPNDFGKESWCSDSCIDTIITICAVLVIVYIIWNYG